MNHDIALRAAALTALFLRGFTPLAPMNARDRRLIRQHLSPPALRSIGFSLAASVLADSALLDRALNLVQRGQVVTRACPAYPRRWQSPLFPDALWAEGRPVTGPFVAILGSRTPDAHASALARDAALWARRHGYAVLSGGCHGIDRIAAETDPCMEIWPCGLAARVRPVSAYALSINAPSDPFSTAAAMARNALIYAAADCAIVIQPRLGIGGSWHGAREALRRRLCPVLVAGGYEGDDALLAMGAQLFHTGLPVPSAPHPGLVESVGLGTLGIY